MSEATFYDKVMKVLNDQIHQIFTASTGNATASLSTSASAALNGTNGTDSVAKFKATTEGLFLAYSSLLLMALIPIVIGSFKSIKHQKSQQESGEDVEIMSTNDALMFPVIASCTLFGIYVVFQVFSKEYINFLLAFYFGLLGVIALTRTTSTVFFTLWPSWLVKNEHYDLTFALTSGKEADKKKEVLAVKETFDRTLIVGAIFSTGVGAWYLMKKHWIANNLFGLAFSVNGIEFLQLNKVANGCILLSGLFLYDIFWVFMTNVMVWVAKSFDAPIKLIFPQDLIENGLQAEKYAMLGLGDIVIPGIFIALLLRFDYSLNRNRYTYFYTTFVAYILALACTIFVMHVFKHAQPALLYIVPLCLIAPLTVAFFKGDLSLMFNYRDHDEPELNKSANVSSTSSAASDEKAAASVPASPAKSEKKKDK